MTEQIITTPSPGVQAPAAPAKDIYSAYRLAGITSGIYCERSFSEYRDKISSMNIIELCDHAGQVEVATSHDILTVRDRLERQYLTYHPEHRDEAATLARQARAREASMSIEERSLLIADPDRCAEITRRCRKTL